jgi:hypothetical protein
MDTDRADRLLSKSVKKIKLSLAIIKYFNTGHRHPDLAARQLEPTAENLSKTLHGAINLIESARKELANLPSGCSLSAADAAMFHDFFGESTNPHPPSPNN